jgi:hypothetical protein
MVTMRKIKKIIALSLLSAIISASFAPIAHAGVVKQLVEVDPQQRELELRQEEARMEEYRREVTQQRPVEEVQQVERQVPPPPPPAPVARAVSPDKAGKNKYAGCFICKPIAMLTGAVVGPIVGLARGSVSKAGDLAGSYKSGLGDGVVGTLVGAPTGLVVGGVTGGVSGLANGFLTGIVKGATNPFTSENYSTVSGNYDPYKFLVGGLD